MSVGGGMQAAKAMNLRERKKVVEKLSKCWIFSREEGFMQFDISKYQSRLSDCVPFCFLMKFRVLSSLTAIISVI